MIKFTTKGSKTEQHSCMMTGRNNKGNIYETTRVFLSFPYLQAVKSWYESCCGLLNAGMKVAVVGLRNIIGLIGSTPGRLCLSTTYGTTDDLAS